MLILKVLNNNAVTTIDPDTNNEMVIMGRGLAFGKKSGEEVDKNRIEKIFTLEDEGGIDKVKNMLKNIPEEVLECSEAIISHCESEFNCKLNDHIYLSLADHISFALKRYKDNMMVKNNLLWEIKRIHKKEYDEGVWALKYINSKFGVELPMDEAGFIAFHFINALNNVEVAETLAVTKLVQEMSGIIEKTFKLEFRENDISYDRLITHLKFFSHSLFNNIKIENNEDEFLKLIEKQYNKSYKCAIKIKKFLKKQYDYDVEDAEIVYLSMHIQRVVNNSI